MDYQYFFIPVERGQFILIKAEELIMVQAGDSYATIITTNGNHLSLLSLNALEKKLGPNFCRIHRSFIVAIPHIKKILMDTLLLTGQHEVPISSSYRASFFANLNFLA